MFLLHLKRVLGSSIARQVAWVVVLLRLAQGNVATEDVVMMCEFGVFDGYRHGGVTGKRGVPNPNDGLTAGWACTLLVD